MPVQGTTKEASGRACSLVRAASRMLSLDKGNQSETSQPPPPQKKKKRFLSNRRLHQRVPRFLARNEQLSLRPYTEAGWTPDPYSEGQPTSGLRTFLCNYEPLRASTPEPQTVDDLWGLKIPTGHQQPYLDLEHYGKGVELGVRFLAEAP